MAFFVGICEFNLVSSLVGFGKNVSGCNNKCQVDNVLWYIMDNYIITLSEDESDSFNISGR